MNDSAALRIAIDIETLSAFLYLLQRAAKRSRSGWKQAFIVVFCLFSLVTFSSAETGVTAPTHEQVRVGYV